MADEEQRILTHHQLLMRNPRIRVFAVRDYYRLDGACKLVAAAEAQTQGETYQMVPTWERLEGVCSIDPAMQLQADRAQELMDTLWDCGLRPSEGHGSTGQLAAVQAHLADMQRLVFGPKGPGRGA